ncbi:hypothetical protein [Lentzea flava]|uniref:MarR family protein n=1 Tax=Lentzea flava TaxID=103732 RepID=A0ABQ2UIU2_9PSEU|nr:hypothetical protein [Lentzea flava]MCP2199965.1 hypothetical protein [Lentzea flava]GGU39653.1 hypothetical protein GCM10010178_34960 [Lentzea flava]
MPSKTVRQSSKINAKRSKTSVIKGTSVANTASGTMPKAEDKLWSVLRDNPGSTTAELADKAEIGKSTAARFLAKWATDGSAARTPGTGPRGADTWAVPVDVPPVETTAEENTSGADPTTSTLADAAPPDDGCPIVEPDEATTESVSRRLPPGGLHGMVEDFLRAHPGEEFGPGAIAKALDRSSGAVSNALDKMTASRLVVQTCPKPKRFQLAPAERNEAKK